MTFQMFKNNPKEPQNILNGSNNRIKKYDRELCVLTGCVDPKKVYGRIGTEY